MIICHCNVISSKDIESAIERLLEVGPDTVITPTTVFRDCGKRPDCGNCIKEFVDTIRRMKVESPEASSASEMLELIGEARTAAAS